MSRKNTVIGVLVFCTSSVLLAGCGDGEPQESTSQAGNTGGATTLSTAHTGGNSSTANSTGGSSNVGGSSAKGGSQATGGSGEIAGTSNTNVGGGTAGAVGNAGATATGGSVTVSSSATGGSSQNGGSSATGGSAALTCTASFVAPANNQTLSNSDDLNATCTDGIQTNVVVATSAPDGTSAALSVTNSSGTPSVIATVQAAGAVARFNNVTLPSTGQGTTGQATLSVAIGGTACTQSETIFLNCAGAPSCSIASPTITLAHPALNGVPVAQGGDRVSSTGSPYQVAFQIATSIEDGQPVALTIDGTLNYQTTASGGKASFAGVLMIPDGTHTASATCTAKSGVIGSSGSNSYPVDTTPPVLTPEKGTGTGGATISPLVNGDHFAIADDADPNTAGLQIKFCGATTSTDALDIPSTDPNAVNFCAAIGGNTPVCAAATAAAGNGACVNINCPGNGAFSVALTLKDAAGNPTTSTTTNVTCASANPTVTFLDPLSDGPLFSDVTKRILAANNTGATRKDINATTPGAQYNVIACTSAPTGSTAILSLGYMGQTLTQAATIAVVADTSSVCSGGNLVQFNNVTLPESLTDSSFNLTTATELQVSVTDLNLATGSATADVWVDSTDPSLTLLSPTGFCGSFINTDGTGSATASINLTFASAIPVVVTVQGPGGSATFTGSTVVSSQVIVSGVALVGPGSDTVSAVATKPSSNFGTFGSCTVTVGDTPPPTVTWQTPLSTSLLTAAGNTNTNAIADGNSATAGWQGTLTACTNIDTTANPGATVQFSANGTNIGSPVAIDATSQCATLANATVPDGAAVLLTATTSPVAGNPGVASITVPVDTTIPTAPSGLGAVVKNRRQTSFTLSWLAPSDGTNGNVTGYQIRIAKSVISTQAAFNAATSVTLPVHHRHPIIRIQSIS